jgi:type II secretory pathway predicted ATPase ExeA
MPKVTQALQPIQLLLTQAGLTQAGFSGLVESRVGKSLGPTSFSLIVRQGIWPKLSSIAFIKESMRTVLLAHDLPPQKIDEALDALPLPEHPVGGPDYLSPATAQLLEDSMILRRQTLTSLAMRHFGLFRSPFLDEVRKSSDVFQSGEIRYIRETMWQTASHGDFVALVGESGAGKSTLRRDMHDRARSAKSELGGEIIIIEPHIVGMDPNDAKGNPLKALHIANCVLARLAPHEKIRSGSSDRFAQMHEVLEQSHRAGNKHVLIIEEAHALPQQTLKHLKRIHELEDGFTKLIGILLIGQPELKTRLTTNVFHVREVTQRCVIVELRALDNDLEAYLTHKLGGHGKNLDDIFDPAAVQALRDRLMINSGRRDRQEWISMVYPLAVNNMATAAMNSAAELGKSRVTADIVKEL